MKDCVFCAIGAGHTETSLVYQDKVVFAIMTLEQPTPYKVIVIPYAHVETVFDLTDEQAAAIFQATVKVAKAIREVSGCEGMNLVQSNGRAAQQDVFHFHLHILPRFVGDKVVLDWDNTPAPAEQLSQFASDLRSKLHQNVL